MIEYVDEEAAEAPGRGPYSKYWCFTVNNPDGLLDPATWPHLTYCVYQLECSPSGTIHFQGYAEFATRVRRTTLAGIPDLARAWTGPRQGTQAEAITYASKTEDETYVEGPWVYGAPTEERQGRRNDLVALQEDLDAGHGMRDISQNHFGPYLRYPRGIVNYRNLRVTPRSPATHADMEVHWIYGPSGTGKTYAAMELAAGREVCWAAQPKANGLRWTHYNYEEVVILDDYHGSAMTWTDLMRFLNPFPLQLPTDGGAVEFTSKVIIFTSIEHPALVYKAHLSRIGRDWTELERRLSTVTHLTEVREGAFRGGRHAGPNPLVEAESLDNETIVVRGVVYTRHP